MTITVVYDNQPCREALESGWGFSAVITGMEKTILFDTGRDDSLLNNMKTLAIKPESIDLVFLSHIHPDHTGGLQTFLQKNSNVTIYLPQSFPNEFKNELTGRGARIVEVEQPLTICEGVYSTGEVGRWLREQSLILRTERGIVLITGCSHPGIVTMVKAARRLFGDDVLLVMGGFHLEWASKRKIERIAAAFKELAVRYVAPAHCAGEKAKALFQRQFRQNYISIGAAATINLHELL